MTFFSKFFIKTQYSHAHIWSKNVNSVKTTLFYGHKSQKDALFVPLFHEKITALMLIFYQKYVYSLKTHCSYTDISQKNVHSLKNTVLSCVFFFQIFHKKLLLSCTWLVKKCQFCQNYTLFWAKKVNMMSFFPISHKKKYCSYVHILSKNVHSLKRNSSHLHYQKNVYSLKNTVLSCLFF